MSTYTDASLIYYPSGYKAGTAYSLKPTDGSGDLTFTRASTATRVNESGLIESVATGVPRIDYTGGGCGKLLLEPQRTNLAIESETFISWIDGFGSVTLNVATSPDGTTNAASYKDNNTGGTGEVLRYKQINVDAASAYTFSIFFKSSGLSQWAYLQATDYNGTIDGFAYFDILNGVVGINSNLSSTNIENYGDGWYRCSITFIQGVGDTQVRSQFQVVGGNGTKNVTRNGTNGYYVWGAQLESGSYPTSYIPTTTTAVTRVADGATKGSIDSLIGQTEGTIFVDINIDAWDSSSFYFGVYGGGNEIYFACVGTGFLRFKHFGGGTTLAQIQQSGFALGRHKLAARYKNNDWAFYVDGVLIGVDTSGTFSGLIGFCSLGYSSPAAYPSNAKYNSAIIFPTALSNAELATLTTL